MNTVVMALGGQLIRLPSRHAPGQEATEAEAQTLQALWEQNLESRLRHHIRQNPRLSADALRLEAARLFLTYALPPPRREASDPIEQEARALAREALLHRLRAEGLPEPRNLDDHIGILLDHHPALYDRALERVEARLRTDREALSALGLGAAAQ